MLFIIFTLLMLQLQSFSRAMLVMLTAPLGIAGVAAALLLLNRPFGFVALQVFRGPAAATAQNWPSQPIKFIVSQSAGGSTAPSPSLMSDPVPFIRVSFTDDGDGIEEAAAVSMFNARVWRAPSRLTRGASSRSTSRSFGRGSTARSSSN